MTVRMSIEELHYAVMRAAIGGHDAIRSARHEAERAIDTLTLDRATSHIPTYLVAAIRKNALAEIERAGNWRAPTIDAATRAMPAGNDSATPLHVFPQTAEVARAADPTRSISDAL